MTRKFFITLTVVFGLAITIVWAISAFIMNKSHETVSNHVSNDSDLYDRIIQQESLQSKISFEHASLQKIAKKFEERWISMRGPESELQQDAYEYLDRSSKLIEVIDGYEEGSLDFAESLDVKGWRGEIHAGRVRANLAIGREKDAREDGLKLLQNCGGKLPTQGSKYHSLLLELYEKGLLGGQSNENEQNSDHKSRSVFE